MNNYIFLFLVLSFILLNINILLKRLNIFVHSNSNDSHKKFGSNGVPLSGGIFFFLVLLYLYKDQNILDNTFFVLIIFYFILGLFVDLNIEINPKLRLLFQVLLTIFLVIFGKIFVENTNLYYLDLILNNYIFHTFFSVFCILVVLNGLNFMDGVNNNVIGFITLIILSIILIENKNQSLEDIEFYNFLFISCLVFYLFNFFNKSFLGDSGIYILSISISVLVIIYVNKDDYLSPLLAVNFLWYPAIETLFSIIRKLLKKKNPFEPDSHHFHTLVMKFLSLNKIKNVNTITGLMLNLFLIPNFYIAINYYNNSKIIIITSLIYLVLYIILYLKLNSILYKNYK